MRRRRAALGDMPTAGQLVERLDVVQPSGGEIRVDVRAEAGWAAVWVADHGLGIPAADQPYVFDRFRRASNVGRLIAGSGLGLAGARDIVEQHGGSIAVSSEEGRGSTFVIRLPLEEQASAP